MIKMNYAIPVPGTIFLVGNFYPAGNEIPTLSCIGFGLMRYKLLSLREIASVILSGDGKLEIG